MNVIKRILGLDLGTNSIGWAIIQIFEDGTKKILKLGSRIIPMDGAEMSNFKKGFPQTKNAKKREKKGIRVGNKRYKQRRNKLIYILQKLDLLPEQINISKPFNDPLKIQKVNVLPIDEGTEQLSAKEFIELKARAIHKPVSAKEFGKILYRFNQLRGYAGGDDSDDKDELNEVLGVKSDKVFPSILNKTQMFKIVSVEKTDEKEGKQQKEVYIIEVVDADGKIWEGTTTTADLKIDESIEFRQTIKQNSKTGEITSIKFFIPKKSSWRKQIESLEEALEKYSKVKGRNTYVSEYFLTCLDKNKWHKVRGNVILRSRYLEEFDAIWQTQFEAHLKQVKKETIEEIVDFLFPGKKQEKYRQEGIEKGLYHIIRNQIIYFQRKPKKDQSHLISDCRFEEGEKAVSKSHPLFQEYRIWEQINKLSINRRTQVGTLKNGKPKFAYNERSISTTFKEKLFEELQEKQSLKFGTVLNKLKKSENFEEGKDFFNGLSSKGELVGNSTRIQLKKKLGRFWDILNLEKNVENQIELWDILYNAKGNEYDLESERNKKISTYLLDKGVEDADFDKIVIAISCIKFPRNYASISEKAVTKTLPLVRAGKYFDANLFPQFVNERIIKLLNEQVDDPFDKSVQSYLERNESLVLSEGGFINAYALMLLYGKHTAKEIDDEEVFNDFNQIKALKRHSLRNPLVEQIVNETLMVVKDIWRHYGKPTEIKIELARELKNSIKERDKIHKRNEKGRKWNSTIKGRLLEMKVNASSGNIEKYKLWHQQNEIDPYTGKVIKISDLFDKDLYDVDHIIPQSRYFDDSMQNKVLCATVVNRDKSNRTAMEYFDTGSSKVNLYSKEEFMDHVSKNFFGKKAKNLLATKIPDNPVERQKKETQYISIKTKEELGKIVGTSNIKVSSGGVTHYLRNHWGVTEIFKILLKERFEKFYKDIKAPMEWSKIQKEIEKESSENIDLIREYFVNLSQNQLTKEQAKYILDEYDNFSSPISEHQFCQLYLECHIYKSNNHQIIHGYSKRFDHRHHAMDALVVACTDEKAVKRLNDLNKHLQDWLKENINQFDLDISPDDDALLENFFSEEESVRKLVLKGIEKFRNVELPWKGFHADVEKALDNIIVSHKPKDDILIQNKEEKNEKGYLVKTDEKTIRIRGPLHEETLYGISQGFETIRIPLTKFSKADFDTVGNIEKIVNSYLKNKIKNHFENTFNKSKSEAFGEEGLFKLNKELEKDKHPPISSVKVYRKKIINSKSYKISLQRLSREKSYNKNLYVKTGSNYLFAVLEKEGKRTYDIISLFDAVSYLKEEFRNTKNKNNFNKESLLKKYFEVNNNAKLLFLLKKLDLVYLPTESEDIILDNDSPLYKEFWANSSRGKNIYIVKKLSGKQIYFHHHTTSELIKKYDTKTKLGEQGSQDRLEFVAQRKIVEFCFPIVLDRLGNIQSVYRD